MIIRFRIFLDNHDIIGLKFYELEVEKDEQTVRNTGNTDNIIPSAEKSEPHRGSLWIFSPSYLRKVDHRTLHAQK